jgi:RNA polymerase sigma-70 factor, ECF subfamily
MPVLERDSRQRPCSSRDRLSLVEMPVHIDDSCPGVRPKPEQTVHASVRRTIARIGSGDAPALEAVAGNDLDRALIAAIAAGDEAAFNEIHARYYPRVARFIRRITRCSELIAEITNDTLWAIWRCAPNFKDSSRVSTWIMGIANHIGSKTLQRRSRREAHEEPMLDLIEAAHEPWSDGDDREWIGAALVQLVEEQRTVLELFYRFGHSCEEIAELVDCPTNTVKSRMFHGRRNMLRLLPRLAGIEAD